jgi:uncharacterized membrane protein YhaH (DUF805 family)
MELVWAETVVRIVSAYVLVGLAFSLPFITLGVRRIDERARDSAWTFRVLLIPGTVLFWPLLLARWAAGSMAPPTEINSHRRRAK